MSLGSPARSPWDVAADILDPPVDPYRHDPALWVGDVLGEHLWSKQVEIMESVRDNAQTAVPACHGPGKSFVAARIAAWWIAIHPPGTAKVLTSAPTFYQVKSILWGELATTHAKGKLPGRMNTTEWWIGDTMVAFGRKPKDPAKAGPAMTRSLTFRARTPTTCWSSSTRPAESRSRSGSLRSCC
jgi:hypothetical protein